MDQRLGSWGPVFVAGFYVLAAVLLIPGSVLTLGAGFLFGVVTRDINSVDRRKSWCMRCLHRRT